MALTLTRGIIRGAQKGLIYGVAGGGKSSLCAHLQDPIFIDSEDGTKELDVARYSVSTWRELEEAISLVENSDAKTLVIDSIDWVEKLLTHKVCEKGDEKGTKRERIEDFGYGKGWKYLREEFEKFLFRLDGLLRKGKHVVLIGHSEVVKFQEPERAEAYDRYELKLDKENSANVREWCGFVIFLNWKVSVIQTDSGVAKKSIGVGGKERVLYTQHSAGWDAKNRHGLADKLKCEIKSLEPIFGNPHRGSALDTEHLAKTGEIREPDVQTPVETFNPVQDGPSVRRTIGVVVNAESKNASGMESGPPSANDRTAGSNPATGATSDDDVIDQFLLAVKDLPREKLMSFLIHRGKIPVGGKISDVDPVYAKRALKTIDGFNKAVQEFQG